VMEAFFAALESPAAPPAESERAPERQADAQCDEELLQAFAPRA